MERRLVALLALDVVGYSGLMREDEEGTLANLVECRRLIDGTIATRGGRISNTAGDSVLAEFPSPVEAVRCASEIQTGNASRNETRESGREMRLRIGVHLGDVIEENGDLFGDGVNVVARLEAISQPDGLCISRSVFDQIRDRLEISFQDMGPQQVKNIDRPIQA